MFHSGQVFHEKISTGGRTITNLRFADDFEREEGAGKEEEAGEEEELAKLAERLDKASTAYGIEISAEKTKWMTKNTRGIKEIKVNEQKLETVTSFKYLSGLSCI